MKLKFFAEDLVIRIICDPLPFSMEGAKAEQVNENLQLTYRSFAL